MRDLVVEKLSDECGYIHRCYPHILATFAGWDALLADVVKRLRCSKSASAENAVVGNDGVVGISLFMGGESTPSRAVVQSAGQGFRLEAQVMKDEFNRVGGAPRGSH